MSKESKSAISYAVPIVAIGASAGGLEACRALLKSLPGKMQAAFVLILHLDPTHDSLMVDLLAHHSSLNVVLAADGMVLRPGYLYVIPPGVFLTVQGGTLRTSSPESGKAVRLPFDVFLQSLAREMPRKLACIILSGTGTDGSGGLDAIREAGGLILAQDPKEAGYSGMPESAVATGLVHHVLRVGDMPAVLRELETESLTNATQSATSEGTSPARTKAGPAAVAAGKKSEFDEIIALVAQTAPQDVTLYKSGTIQRRIARRMAISGCEPGETQRYLAKLRADKAELEQLSADLLIHVTSFFRDPAAFEHLSRTALPALIAELPSGRPLRVWVAGCSTGEEAYSLSMLCIEALEKAGSRSALQLFASDIDPEALAVAKDGFYASDIETAVSPERLARFFVREGNGWRVRSTLRDVIVFTVADLLSDPPLSRIDLLSCRNVLIYLEPEAQRRVIGLCCFALRPGGLLFLGEADTPGPDDDRFQIADKNARLWRRVWQGRSGELLSFLPASKTGKPHEQQPRAHHRAALADLCRQIVLDTYAPAAVLLTRSLECLYLLGPTERYLSATKGHSHPGILGMLPRNLHVRFRDAAAVCDASNPYVVVPGGHSPTEGRFNIELRAVDSGAEQLLLACFVRAPLILPSTRSDDLDAQAGNDADRIAELEAELASTREELRDALQDLAYEVEGHSLDRAESLSVNEEFQATNEELLSSKEELQALNEELTALNAQLQENLDRHRATANDLENVLNSTDVATLFLDRELKIRFFTPAARAQFRVIANDIGRPLSDLATVFPDKNLAADTRAVLESSRTVEREISGADGAWFLRRIQPYRTDRGAVDGVVITFIDITERKRIYEVLVAAKQEAERATAAKSRFLAGTSHDLRQPLQSLALLHALLARGEQNPEALRLTKILDRTLNSMKELVDSLLDVTRIESGIAQPQKRAIAILPLLERLGDEFAPLCEEKGLRLRIVRCKSWVLTDPQLLEQVLRNLLSNALKYTEKGSILFGCRRKGKHLTVNVCDTGIGVAESEVTAIFEAYYQAGRPESVSANGLGLGLSIVQRIAKLLDHPIAVRSVQGKGSVFMITLPVVAAQEAEPANTLPKPEDEKEQTGTILLVEDEADMRQLLVESLEGAGHKVVAISNAADALAWAADAAQAPDLLLADFELRGGKTGLSLAQQLPDVLGVSVPTIILSGSTTKETLQSIAETPFERIAKPVTPETLLARISLLMHEARVNARRVIGPAASDQTTVHIVDDDPMIRETTRRLFESVGWSVVTHPSAEDFLAAPRPGTGACLVVDGVLPGMSGLELLEVLREEDSTLPAVMLTGHGDATMAVNALKAGAADLIEKPASASDLLSRIGKAIEGSLDERARINARRAAQESFADLTPREREVLDKVLSGVPNKIIAADLGINQRTVENHRAAVMRKTGAKSLAELVRLALAAELPKE